jgi:hypothetical protein
VLHLLNGDATASRFPAALPGDRDVWRDIMVEGPAVDDGAARAAWLAPRLGVTPAEYECGWREGHTRLAHAAAHDEVVLWFEQDLFCAVNVWYVLEQLPASTPVSLVFPPLTHAFDGLGTLPPEAFGPLFEERVRVSDSDRADASRLWRAYAAPEPTELPHVGGRFPFARHAVRLHLGRFPSTTHGLDEIELATLNELVAGPQPFSALFRSVMHGARLRPHGMGDVQFAAALRDLEPLVAIENAAAPPGQWRMSLTATGADVLAERLDGLASRALDRWLGGVHMTPGSRVWRWDGGRILRG